MRWLSLKRYPVLAFLTLSMLFPFAHADEKRGKTYCEKMIQKRGGHCAYFTGLSDRPDEGRFIKIIISELNYTGTSCISGKDGLSYYQEQPLLKTNTHHYFICSDLNANQCELIATDSFFVRKKKDRYSADPAFFKVDVSTIKEKYPACTSSWRLSEESQRPLLQAFPSQGK